MGTSRRAGLGPHLRPGAGPPGTTDLPFFPPLLYLSVFFFFVFRAASNFQDTPRRETHFYGWRTPPLLKLCLFSFQMDFFSAFQRHGSPPNAKVPRLCPLVRGADMSLIFVGVSGSFFQ